MERAVARAAPLCRRRIRGPLPLPATGGSTQHTKGQGAHRPLAAGLSTLKGLDAQLCKDNVAPESLLAREQEKGFVQELQRVSAMTAGATPSFLRSAWDQPRVPPAWTSWRAHHETRRVQFVEQSLKLLAQLLVNS